MRLPDHCSVIQNKYGQQVVALDGDLIGEEIRQEGIYDAEGIEIIEKLLPTLRDSVCLDIGANIGNHSLAMSRLAKQVYAFECQPDIAALFRENIRRNAIGNVRLFEIGLAAEDGQRTFYIDQTRNRGQSSFCKREGQESQGLVLDLKTGDNVLRVERIERVDFIKLDVEGFEAEVMAGLTDTIRRCTPVIMLEWNSEQSRAGFRERRLFETVLEGYQVKAVIHTHHRQLWHGKFMRGLRNSLRKRITPKRLMLGHFYPERDYGNILLLPATSTFSV